jgi:Glycosyl hydrolase family 26
VTRTRLLRLVLATTVVLVPLFVVLSPPSAQAATLPGFGVYAGPGDPEGVQQVGSSMGGSPQYAMDFLDPSSWQAFENPNWPVSVWAGTGYQMIWGVPMIPNSGGSMATGAAGGYDQYFKTLATNFVADGQASSIIRLGWEFNGDWFPWGTSSSTAAQFVAYWQQIVTTMRSVPGQDFKFEWNPTRGGTVNLASYYPGDSYVDIIGMDVYDTEWATYPGAASEFAYMESEPNGLNWLASFSAQHGKPIAFPEWGLGWGPSSPGSGPITVANTQVSGGDDPTFIADMAAWIGSHNVLEATFWDYGTSEVDDGQNSEAMTALADDTADAGPPPQTPEVPSAMMLPAAVGALLIAAVAVTRRRSARRSVRVL